MDGTAIVAENLSHRFGRLLAVDDLTLRIPAGIIYGFLGPNGSGKSTTIRLLCGLLTVREGKVRVLEHDMPRDAEKIRGKIGYMTQRFSLYEDLTVEENLQFLARVYSVTAGGRRGRIQALLEKYQLEQRRRQRTGTLSGGQKQRLALAAVTLHDPPLLLLDEPTSAVDPQSRRGFWADLFELAARGTTILVSTHYMDEAERCHRLAILDRGRLVAEGAPRTLVEEIDAVVIQVETEQPTAAHRRLEGLPWVRSVAQLGMRLHVLVDRHTEDPAGAIREALGGGGIEAAAKPVQASLEDVFVAATGYRKG